MMPGTTRLQKSEASDPMLLALVAASRESAADFAFENGGALTRRRFRRRIQLGCEIPGPLD